MKPEPRLLRRKRVWPLLVLLLLLMFWFSRQTATVSPASKVTAAGPSESRLAAVAAGAPASVLGEPIAPTGLVSPEMALAEAIAPRREAMRAMMMS